MIKTIFKKACSIGAVVLALTGCSRDEAILYAAANGLTTPVRLFLMTGTNVDATATVRENERLYTPLILAAHEGHIGTVEVLLKNGANPNATDVMGFTALHGAAMNGHKDVVELLLKYGANPRIEAVNDTAATLATKAGHQDIASLLNCSNTSSVSTARNEEPAKRDESTAVITGPDVTGQTTNLSTGQLRTRGEAVYKESCIACHGVEGKGTPGLTPSFVGSEIISSDPKLQIKLVLHGRNLMPASAKLPDQDVAAVVTYTRAIWGKVDDPAVQPNTVATVR